jgi:folate-dependent tRNA-U54 methylase TrmFO/GidA
VRKEELFPAAPNEALVILQNGVLTAEQMEEELKDLVDEDWEWRV